MPRLPVALREAEKVSTPLLGGKCCAIVNDVPPSSSWKIHGNLLLSNLPGDKVKRGKILDKSIISLTDKREEFRREKKTGASVATEALEFYNLVLEMNQTWKESSNIKGTNLTRKSLVGKKINDSVNEEGVEDDTKLSKVLDTYKSPLDKSMTKTTSTAPSNDNESTIIMESIKGKRQRRQTVLFDPQTCPASAWVGENLSIRTKEKSPPTPPMNSNPDPLDWIPDKNPKIMRKVRSFIEDKKEEFNLVHESECKFCMSKEDIIVCCFCACRVCFVKQWEKDNHSVHCDICKADFHTNCLAPPLNPIPSCGEWYCPSCIVTIKTALEEKRMNQKKEKRSIDPPISLEEVKEEVKETLSEAEVVVLVPIKRGPGRPRKNENIKLPIVTSKTTSEPRSKRKRSEESGHLPNKKSRRGPKAMITDSVRVLRSPTKILGANLVSSNTEDDVPRLNTDVILSLDSPYRSRSGRILKRNNFYKHAEKNDQQLKSSSLLNTDEFSIAADNDLLVITDQPVRKNSTTGVKEDFTVFSEKLSTDVNVVDESNQGDVPFGSNKNNLCKESSLFEKDVASNPMDSSLTADNKKPKTVTATKTPRRKPGARECMQISRRFGVSVIPQKYMDILMDYCNRGKVEHLIKMRERLDEHSSFLELQLAGFEALVQGTEDNLLHKTDPEVHENDITII